MGNITEKLIQVQGALKAPKNKYNTFGKYHYRAAEDILEAAKPLLREAGLLLTLSDEIMQVGDRIYVKAVATLLDTESGGKLTNTAYARESQEKKGMDDSQVTGTASSYARKYALNGLFLIDDTKDADTNEYREEATNRANGQAKPQNATQSHTAPSQQATGQPPRVSTLSEKQIARAYKKGEVAGQSKESIHQWIKTKYGVEDIKNLNRQQYDELCAALDRIE